MDFFAASLAGMKAEDKRIVRSCGFLNDTRLAPASVRFFENIILLYENFRFCLNSGLGIILMCSILIFWPCNILNWSSFVG